MPLRLLTGRANSGKSGEVRGFLSDAVRRGEEPVLILPTRADVARARADLAAECPTGLTVTRFERFLSDAWERGGDGRAVVTPSQRALLLRRLLDGGPHGPGMARLAGRVVRTLADAAGERWREARGRSATARLVADYAAELAGRGLIEPGEIAGLLERRGALPSGPVAVHRFTDLTAGQEALLGRLSSAGSDLLVTVVWEEGFAPTEAVTPLVSRLAALGMHDHAIVSQEHTPSDELRRIEAGLFARPEPMPPGGRVVFSTAEGEEAEADRIAAEIVRLRTGCGVPAERIAVVYRRPEGHVTVLGHALAEAGIDADLDVVIPFAATPLGRAFSSLVAFCRSGGREDALGFLRSSYSGAPPAEVVRIERGWREGALERGDGLEPGLAALTGTAKTLIDRARVADRPGDAAEVAREWAGILGTMLVACHGRPGRAIRGADQDFAAHDAAMRVLTDLAALGDTDVDASELGAALTDLEVAIGGSERPGHVQVMGVERVRGRRFRAVIVGGLVAGEFPSLAEDALASGDVAELFASVSVDPPRWRAAAAERALFYDAITQASEHLVASRQSTDSDGSPLGPSVFWEELRDFYRSADQETAEEGPLECDRASGMAEVALGEHASNSLRRSMRSAALATCDAGGAASEARVAAAYARSRVRAGTLSASENLAALAARTVFSASELERYASCPYGWFVSRCLRMESVDYEVDGLVWGGVAHAALREIYRPHCGKGERPEADAAAVDAAVAVALREARVPRHLADDVAMAVRARVLRHLRLETAALEGFTPLHVEWSFGTYRCDAPELPLGGWALSGRIDRIDVDPDGNALVIDYKYGQVKRPSEYEAASVIQVPLYMTAVRELLGLTVVGGLYVGLGSTSGPRFRGPHLEGSVSGGVSGTDAVDAAGLEAHLERAAREAGAAVEGIRSGRVGRSSEDDRCVWCAARGMCGGDEA